MAGSGTNWVAACAAFLCCGTERGSDGGGVLRSQSPLSVCHTTRETYGEGTPMFCAAELPAVLAAFEDSPGFIFSLGSVVSGSSLPSRQR